MTSYKKILVFLTLLTSTKVYGQLGYMYHAFPYPNFYATYFGYPSTGYFKLCGPKYKIILYEIKALDKWELRKKGVLSVQLKKEKIKTKASFKQLPYTNKNRYLYINDSLFESSLFWKDLEYGRRRLEVHVTKKDSSILEWTLNTDGTTWKSYRTIYNKQKQIIKTEVAWEFYADNDSTWLLADKYASFVTRTRYEYVNATEVKLTTEKKGIETNRVVERTIRQEYNQDKQLISEKYFDNGVNTETMLFFYKNNICYKCELYKGDKLYRRIVLEF